MSTQIVYHRVSGRMATVLAGSHDARSICIKAEDGRVMWVRPEWYTSTPPAPAARQLTLFDEVRDEKGQDSIS